MNSTRGTNRLTVICSRREEGKDIVTGILKSPLNLNYYNISSTGVTYYYKDGDNSAVLTHKWPKESEYFTLYVSDKYTDYNHILRTATLTEIPKNGITRTEDILGE